MIGISYFYAAAIKHHDQGNFSKDEFIWLKIPEGLESIMARRNGGRPGRS